MSEKSENLISPRSHGKLQMCQKIKIKTQIVSDVQALTQRICGDLIDCTAGTGVCKKKRVLVVKCKCCISNNCEG